jgi:NAD(P)-dependent dehydrogenase (short-subunit alcohol dehydrogenase family)
MLARSGHPVGDGPGLTVNAITPGYVATDTLTSIPEKVMDTFRSKIPVGRSLWSGRRGT